MKRKSVLFSGIVVLAAAGYAFYRGYVPFHVPAGSFGVLSSKTCGVYPEPVYHGKFLWRWEPLIPTNASLNSYPRSPKTYSCAVSGSLPSAELYAAAVKGRPDFSYSFEFEAELCARPESVVRMTQESGAVAPEQLEAATSSAANSIASDAAAFLLGKAEREPSFAAGSVPAEQILEGIRAEEKYPDFQVLSLRVAKASVPDVALYDAAKKAYFAYSDALSAGLREEGAAQARASAADKRIMERLEQLGGLLDKHPGLASVLNGGDISAVLEKMESQR